MGCVVLAGFALLAPAADDPPAAAEAAQAETETSSGESNPGGDSPPTAGSKPKEADAGKPPEPKSEEPAEEPTSGDEPAAVLKQAREKLLGFRSIKAKIVETVALGNRRFKAEGIYQQGSNLKLRLEFQVKSGETEGSLLEVCDGQVLWTRYSVGETSRISRRDVRQILEAFKAAKQGINDPLAELGLGGLPALMASVESNMAFNAVREEEIDGQKFLVLDGRWNKRFMDEYKRVDPKAERLPAHIPDTVRVYLDSATLLPRRFLYLKRDQETKQNRPMVTVDFVDLVLNAPISEDEFYFIPPEGVPQEDITSRFIEAYTGTRATQGAAQ